MPLATAAVAGPPSSLPSSPPSSPRGWTPPRVLASSNEPSGLASSAHKVLLLFVFLYSSRVLDFTLPSLHLPLILAVIAAGLTFASGNVWDAFASPIGKLMGLFTFWFVVCVPFSQWRGESYAMLTDTLLKSFLLFTMVASSIHSVRQVRGVMVAIGTGSAVAMGIALTLQFRPGGRLSMPVGLLSNPNDLAQMFLVGICLITVLGVALPPKQSNVVFRAAAVLMPLPFLYAIFETASRGALVTLGVLVTFLFFSISVERKLMLVIGSTAIAAGLFSFSGTARERLGTMFSDDTNQESYSEVTAVASSANRKETLLQSFRLTLENPLFGVGPGVFQSAAAQLQHDDGRRALWVETHNAYTQVSSETGIPGAIFFCGAVLGSLFGLLRLTRNLARIPQLASTHRVMQTLFMAMLAFAISSVFSSVAYQFSFWILIGLSSAAIIAGKQALAAALAQTPVPASARPMPWAPVPRIPAEEAILRRAPLAQRKRLRG